MKKLAGKALTTDCHIVLDDKENARLSPLENLFNRRLVPDLRTAGDSQLPAQDTRDKLPDWLPKHAVNLGLDLQGGSQLLLEVDFDAYLRDQLTNLTDEIRNKFRDQKIGYRGLSRRRRQSGVFRCAKIRRRYQRDAA